MNRTDQKTLKTAALALAFLAPARKPDGKDLSHGDQRTVPIMPCLESNTRCFS